MEINNDGTKNMNTNSITNTYDLIDRARKRKAKRGALARAHRIKLSRQNRKLNKSGFFERWHGMDFIDNEPCVVTPKINWSVYEGEDVLKDQKTCAATNADVLELQCFVVR